MKSLLVLVLLAIAGTAAGAGLGTTSSGAAARPACKPTKKVHCPKPKPKRKTVTVTRTRTVTSVATTVQTVTGSTTQTVTSTQPFFEPRVGTYHGTAANEPLSLTISVTSGGYLLQSVSMPALVFACPDGSAASTWSPLYFGGSIRLDGTGHLSGTLSASESRFSVTATFAGAVNTNGTASGTVSFSGTPLHPAGAAACTVAATGWSASL